LVATSTYGLCQTITVNGILLYYTFFYTDFSLFFKVGAKRQPFETVFAVPTAFPPVGSFFADRPLTAVESFGARAYPYKFITVTPRFLHKLLLATVRFLARWRCRIRQLAFLCTAISFLQVPRCVIDVTAMFDGRFLQQSSSPTASNRVFYGNRRRCMWDRFRTKRTI
jgi:hypothetical protein